MNWERHPRSTAFGLIVAVAGLPFLGAALAGRELGDLFLFPPPLRIPSHYVRFSWAAAGAVVVALVVLAGAWAWGAHRAPEAHLDTSRNLGRPQPGRFPAWGWLALAWTLAWWAVAWTRLPVFAPAQHYTFFPLWLGFVITVNAWTCRCSGTCLMRRSPGRWLALFLVSAVFWWGFEWLNRFVQNWHYLAVEDFGPMSYAVNATLSFSTVLPAVAAVAEALQASRRWRSATHAGPRWSWLDRPAAAGALAAAGAIALLLTGVWPSYFYPALWSAPLALGLARSTLVRRVGFVADVACGTWTEALTWMSAGLICGLFWEMWNSLSLAKWVYTVPGVDRWHVFEMPLLGYSGYLPFGLECLLVFESIQAVAARRGGRA